MKEFLPILLGALFFTIQTYSNYKKEQEKAKNRKLGKPVPDDTIPIELPSTKSDKKISHQKEIKTPGTSLKRDALTQKGLKSAKPKATSSTKSVYLNKNIEIEHLDTLDESEQEGAGVDLDLREAVIHQVILERKF